MEREEGVRAGAATPANTQQMRANLDKDALQTKSGFRCAYPDVLITVKIMEGLVTLKLDDVYALETENILTVSKYVRKILAQNFKSADQFCQTLYANASLVQTR